MATATGKRHEYTARVRWTGNLGEGTATYAGYSRDHVVEIAGKPELAGSSDPIFRGTPERHNPEDLFVAALSSCHMLAYLALCARGQVRVTSYEDEAEGVLALFPEGGGRFEEVTLRPVVTVSHPEMAEAARALHETAHERCFIASSCSVPVRVEPVVKIGVNV
jgi:organic hydroperoxide reductase OsmC/OhrA